MSGWGLKVDHVTSMLGFRVGHASWTRKDLLKLRGAAAVPTICLLHTANVNSAELETQISS
jgi:hypothetical protein